MISKAEHSDNSHVPEVVGSFLATLCATRDGVEILSEKSKDRRHLSKVVDTVKLAVESGVGSFPALSVQLIDRLGAIQKHIAMFDETQPEQSNIQLLQIQANVPELPMTASRYGTILYLESMIFTARTIDDTIVFNFLAGRHNNDWTAMFLDVLLSSFRVLKRSHDDTQQYLRYSQTKLFIRNKLPTILATISGSSFGVISPEKAIVDSWTEVKAELTDSDLLTCSHHFLHICSLLHLLPVETVQDLADNQELLAKLSKGLYSKDDLVSQIQTNHSRIYKLVDELGHADGSGAATSQAIVEVIAAYSQSKESHHLRDLANAILKKPDAINAIALFIRPSYWLGPLCTLLDEWTWNDIHSESQPMYEEFGSILLLVSAARRRLALSDSETGMQDGFVARYLASEGVEDPNLPDASIKHLGDWIYALYVADALSDEVTTSCSPQDFYMLLPNLLRQSMMAYQKGKLSLDALKGGLEYLLEPFLLPSLVSAITWAKHDPTATELLIPLFTKPTENEIHRTILAMNASETWSFGLGRNTDFERDAATYINGGKPFLPSSLRSLMQARGPEAALQAILRTLSNNLSTALDVMATLICVGDRQLRDLLRLKFTTLKDTPDAEAIVHLHRRVEAYASVLIVQDIGMDYAQQLDNIDTTNANLDNTLESTQEQQEDEIDQVLNANALSMDHPEISADVSMDDFYGLQNDNMGLGNLDDLDLDMF